MLFRSGRGVQKTRQTRPNPTQPAELDWILGLGGLGWVTNLFFYSGSGWVWVIKLQTRQTRPNPTRPAVLGRFLRLRGLG